MSARKLNICVMLGGTSAEREVSLRSGAGAAKALRWLGHEVNELDPSDTNWKIPSGTEIVFLALHGTCGEDGGMQEKLETLGVPYTGCDPQASRVAFDKVLTKKQCLQAGVPTPRFAVFSRPQSQWPEGWHPPVVLKPVRQGSSIGLQFVDRAEDLEKAMVETLRYDTEVLMEERIIGRETTVGILDGKALPIAEIRVKNGAFDYHHKYTPGQAEHICPAPFDAETTSRIQNAALAAFRAIGGRDFARVDVMVAEGGRPVVLEVNTLPGMTEVSILPEAAAAAGLDYPHLCQRMVDLALRRAKTKPGRSS